MRGDGEGGRGSSIYIIITTSYMIHKPTSTVPARRLRERRAKGVVMVAPVEVGEGGVDRTRSSPCVEAFRGPGRDAGAAGAHRFRHQLSDMLAGQHRGVAGRIVRPLAVFDAFDQCVALRDHEIGGRDAGPRTQIGRAVKTWCLEIIGPHREQLADIDDEGFRNRRYADPDTVGVAHLEPADVIL